MKTLYFSETSPADAAGDAILIPVSSFLSMDVRSSVQTNIMFKKIDGTHDKTTITINHPSGKSLEVMKVVSAAMASNTKSNVIDIVEVGNRHPVASVLGEISSLITGIAIAE
tara:strand:- start:755 stop:1090 length:336 start_codon:yes stop_codon:yes gene_type:complete